MADLRDTTVPGPANIKIGTSAGKIGVTGAALFNCNDDSSLHTLIERLFQSPAVDAISIDRRQTKVEICFNRRALTSRVALRTFSEILNSPPSAAELSSANTASLLRPCLDRLPGPVKRVERQRRRKVDLRSEVAATPAGKVVALLPSAAARTSAFVVDALVVEYDSLPEESENRLLAGSSRGGWGDAVLQAGRRVLYLAAAGGCFVMSIIGIVTPGIPTVPFVLATGYFLARGSTTLHERFKRSAFFGQMVRDYEEHRGLRWVTKLKIILLTAGLILITVIVSGGSLSMIIVAGTMGGLGIYMTSRIPTITVSSPEVAPATLPA